MTLEGLVVGSTAQTEEIHEGEAQAVLDEAGHAAPEVDVGEQVDAGGAGAVVENHATDDVDEHNDEERDQEAVTGGETLGAGAGGHDAGAALHQQHGCAGESGVVTGCGVLAEGGSCDAVHHAGDGAIHRNTRVADRQTVHTQEGGDVAGRRRAAGDRDGLAQRVRQAAAAALANERGAGHVVPELDGGRGDGHADLLGRTVNAVTAAAAGTVDRECAGDDVLDLGGAAHQIRRLILGEHAGVGARADAREGHGHLGVRRALANGAAPRGRIRAAHSAAVGGAVVGAGIGVGDVRQLEGVAVVVRGDGERREGKVVAATGRVAQEVAEAAEGRRPGQPIRKLQRAAIGARVEGAVGDGLRDAQLPDGAERGARARVRDLLQEVRVVDADAGESHEHLDLLAVKAVLVAVGPAVHGKDALEVVRALETLGAGHVAGSEQSVLLLEVADVVAIHVDRGLDIVQAIGRAATVRRVLAAHRRVQGGRDAAGGGLGERDGS
eukprot:m.117493 g.117493  ORF g.117493 m.117493 type:complete len:496 (+) comp9209_c0_seq5:28-1515(+)